MSAPQRRPENLMNVTRLAIARRFARGDDSRGAKDTRSNIMIGIAVLLLLTIPFDAALVRWIMWSAAHPHHDHP